MIDLLEDKMKYFRITYLPLQIKPSVIEWVFRGSDKDLLNYLQEQHGCNCVQCADTNWYETPQACEYDIEDITKEFEKQIMLDDNEEFTHFCK